MTLDEWEGSVPKSIRDDALWRMKVYRIGLYASDMAWTDVTTHVRDQRTIALADQLYRAISSISANIAEGYGRSSGKDRVRFYEYALGSAREARDWYFKARHVLTIPMVEQRIELLSQVIRLLLTIIPEQRQLYFKDESIEYDPAIDP